MSDFFCECKDSGEPPCYGLTQLRAGLAAAQSEIADLRNCYETACESLDLRHSELAAAQEARQAAEALAESYKADAERLQHLIDNAYSGLTTDLEAPMAVGIIIGGQVEWPDGVRKAIDDAKGKP